MLSMLMTTEYAPAEDRHELQQLLLHIAGGERDALAALYQRTRTAVYGLALSYLRNAHDAQDLTQDVYVQVWDLSLIHILSADTPFASISERNCAVMGSPPNRSQWTCPPANRISWNISAPGRFVTSIPNAMGTSSSGSNFLTCLLYTSRCV